MKVDDRIIKYEIDRYTRNSPINAAEDIDGRPSSLEKRAEGPEIDSPIQDAVVHLSRRSREAEQITRVISSEPEVREEKVSALREEIESGRYRIDHEAVADNIVDAFIEEVS